MEGLYLKITQDFTPDPKEARFGGVDAPMAVEKGDIIFDVRKRGEGWLYGKNINSGKTGKFPDSCAAKLTGNGKKGSGSASNSLENDKKDEKKPADNNDSKPSWLQNKSTTPATRKTPLYPKPFAGNSRGSPGKEKEEKKETSGDSGVVEDSPDGNYCNDDEKSSIAKTEGDAPETGSSVKDDKQKKSKADRKPLASSVLANKQQRPEVDDKEEKTELPSRSSARPFRLYGKTSEPKALPRGDTKNTTTSPPKGVSSPKEPSVDDNYEPVENSGKETEKLPKAAAKNSQSKEEPKTKTVAKAVKTPSKDLNARNQPNVKPINSAGGTGLNIKENPLSKDEEGVYQVPQVSGPKKPARSGLPGCSECNEPHIYDTPIHYKTLPASPTMEKNNYEPAEQKEISGKTEKRTSTSLKPTSSVIRKTKENMKHRMASYESIEAEVRRSTESIKEAVKAVRETKEKLLASNKWSWIRILVGIIMGILLGVFICLTFYFLAHLHIVICVVSALIIGLVVAITLGFLDKTRIQCIVLLIFPSIFATGGKLSLWLLITYFLVSGPLCNFIENVRVTALTRGCLMRSNISNNNSAAGFVVVSAENREIVNRIKQHENISLALKAHLNDSLLSTYKIRHITSRGNGSSGAVCISFLQRARDSCEDEINIRYSNCTQLLAPTGNKQEVERKCEFLTPRNACDYLTDGYLRRTCEDINAANINTLLRITKIVERSPERIRTREVFEEHAVITTGNVCEFTSILVMLLPLLVLLILYEAYRYHKLYLSRNEFDNHFLTLRFKSIEDMRKSSGASDLLVPLKKAELKRFVQPTACQLAECERDNMLKYLAFYFVYLMFALIIVLLDYFFYVVITNEQPQSNISKRCEGELKSLGKTYVIVISTLLGFLFLVILLQAFVLRLRRLIVSRFYPRRERKRIAYLYYRLLEERKNFYKSVIEKMNNFSDENEMFNKLDVVLVLCNNFPWFKALLQFVGLNLRRCTVCGTGLNRKYIYCDTEDCGVIYCRTCFWDLEGKCLGCMRNSKVTSRSSSVSGQSQRKKNDYVKSV